MTEEFVLLASMSIVGVLCSGVPFGQGPKFVSPSGSYTLTVAPDAYGFGLLVGSESVSSVNPVRGKDEFAAGAWAGLTVEWFPTTRTVSDELSNQIIRITGVA